MLQEEDVIGVLPSGDKISNMKPLGDRVLIKVRPAAAFSFSGREQCAGPLLQLVLRGLRCVDISMLETG
jgi:hypothetical protein